MLDYKKPHGRFFHPWNVRVWNLSPIYQKTQRYWSSNTINTGHKTTPWRSTTQSSLQWEEAQWIWQKLCHIKPFCAAQWRYDPDRKTNILTKAYHKPTKRLTPIEIQANRLLGNNVTTWGLRSV